MIAKATADPGTVYDVLIIGGGITGMTAALMLQNAGKKCLLKWKWMVKR